MSVHDIWFSIKWLLVCLYFLFINAYKLFYGGKCISCIVPHNSLSCTVIPDVRNYDVKI